MAGRIDRQVTRRDVLLGGIAAGSVIVLSACSDDDDDSDRARAEDPDGASEAPEESTPEQTEGPFFTPDTPEKADFRDDVAAGALLVVSGRVVTADGRPVGGTMLDFWQADDDGNYDNEGFRLRGHQFADDDGRWRLDTIVPGLYPGRTRHIHVKVRPPGGSELTTQLYFPDEPANEGDGIFDADLLMDLAGRSEEQEASFTFVLDP